MSDLETALNGIIRRAAAVRGPEDYMQDGLIYCGHCHTPKQCRIDLCGETRVLGCQCACASRRYDAEKAADAERQRNYRIAEMRAAGMADKAVRGYTFAAAEDTEEIRRCKIYADHFDEAKESGRGLLFWGNTGSGKTYAAACIANQIVDRGIPALVTSFPKILAAGWNERAQIARQLNAYSLLVLDDLGAERGSDYALETVYMVIDERYKSGLPLIITTNLSLKALNNPQSMEYQRIYDRVLEMCTPICFKGESRRKGKAEQNLKWLKELM